jgi:Flp pilus assembly CpaF family ATPase
MTAAPFQLAVEPTASIAGVVVDLTAAETRIGRDASNEVRLPSPFVSRLHASITRRGSRMWIRSEGLNPTVVNGRELQPGESAELRAGDAIVIQGFLLKIRAADHTPAPSDDEARTRFTAAVTTLHEKVINRLDPRVFRLDSIKSEDGRRAAVRVLREELEKVVLENDPPLLTYASREALRTTLLLSLLGQTAGPTDEEPFGRPQEYADREQARFWLASRMASTLGLKLDGTDGREGLARLRVGFDGACRQCRDEISPDMAHHLVRWLLRKEISDLVFGLGPLTDLLRMPDVTEIMVVSKDQIYIEQGGVLAETGRTFVSDRVSEQILERILGPINRRVDRSSPMADARLPDGSRVNAIIPPLALKGPCLTIRRFSQDPLNIDDLIGFGAITSQVATFLRACVKGRKNIIISGGTGSGKTTLLNALSGWIPPEERIVTIEDTAELRLQQRHVVTLEARPPNAEQRGEVTIRDLVRNALRMRPDRIVVGECRGREALDMLQAMNTGHAGSMTTGHANSPGDMLQRLEVMVLEAAALPLAAIRRQIVSAIDLVIHQSRVRDGSRRVVTVSEVVGLDDVTGDIVTEDVFSRGEGGELAFTGYLPTFASDLISAGHLNAGEVFLGA